MSKTPEQLDLAQRIASELAGSPSQTANALAAQLGQPIKAILAVLNDDSRFTKAACAQGWAWSLEQGGAKADRWRSEPATATSEKSPSAAPGASAAPASPPLTAEKRRAQQEALLATVEEERERMGWSRPRLSVHLDISVSTWSNARKYLLSDPIRAKLEAWLKTVRLPMPMPPAKASPVIDDRRVQQALAGAIAATASLVAREAAGAPAGVPVEPPPAPPAPSLTKLQSTAVLGDVPIAELLGNADRLNASLVDLGSLASASTVRQLASLVRGMRAVLGA
jgi:hypothetical protein